MPEITKAHDLLRKAQEKQRIGAVEALGALLTEHAEDPEASYEGGWRTVVWKDPDDAEMALRFLDAYPV